MKKKLLALVLCVFTLVCTTVPAFAANTSEVNPDVTVEVVDLGDGFTAVITSDTHVNFLARAMVSANKSCDIYHAGKHIGYFSLTGYFEYTGSSVRATDCSDTAVGDSGWTADGTSSYSGNRVSGYCTVSNGSKSTSASLSISCDSKGNIS